MSIRNLRQIITLATRGVFLTGIIYALLGNGPWWKHLLWFGYPLAALAATSRVLLSIEVKRQMRAKSAL